MLASYCWAMMCMIVVVEYLVEGVQGGRYFVVEYDETVFLGVVRRFFNLRMVFL